MYCQSRTAVKGQGQEFLAVSLRCRSWTCPECGDQRRKELMAEAIDGQPTKFLTLTSKRRDGMTPIEAARELARCWRLVRKRLMRHYRWKSLPFLAVFEATQLGWPHLHILLRSAFIDHKLVSQWMDELSASPVVWIEAIEHRNKAVKYVSKYIGKNSEKFGTCKRYWKSQDWRVVPKRHKRQMPTPKGDWDIFKWPITRWIDSMQDLGARVDLLAQGVAYASLAPILALSFEGSGGSAHRTRSRIPLRAD